MCWCIGCTAFHEASIYNKNDSLRLIIAAGARFTRNVIGYTALQAAVARRDPQVTDAEALATLQILMKAPNAHEYLNVVGKEGSTTLGLAAMNGLINTCKFLVEQKANVNVSIIAGSGVTALHVAVEHGCLEAAKYLVSAGACTHPVMYSSLVSRLSDCAKRDPIKRWCRSVETPRVQTCDKCGIDMTKAGLAKFRNTIDGTHKALEKTSQRCSNPACVTPKGITLSSVANDVAVVRLKSCSRCLRVRYCSVECQRQHWKSGHKMECKR